MPIRKKILKYLSHLVLFVLLTIPVFGNYFYPYKINFFKSIDLGEIIHTNNEFYILNYGLFGENSYIYKTNNFNPESGLTLPNASLLYAKSALDRLILLTSVNDSLFLVVYSDNTISHKIYISSSFENYYKLIDIQVQKNNILLQIDKNIYLFNITNNFPKVFSILSQNALDANFYLLNDKVFIAIVEEESSQNVIKFFDSDGNIFNSLSVPSYNNVKIIDIHNYLSLIFSSFDNKSLIYLINKRDYTVGNSIWINSNSNFIAMSNNTIYSLQTNEKTYVLSKIHTYSSVINNADFPIELVEPIYLKVINNRIYAIFKNGICITDTNLSIQAVYFFNISQQISEIINVFENKNQIIITSKSNSMIFEIKDNQLSVVKFFFYEYAKYIIPILIVLIMLFLINKIIAKSKLLNIIANIPSAGFLFIINHRGKLIFANDYASNLISLSRNVPLNKNFRDYFKNDAISEVYKFYEINKSNKKTIKEKLSLNLDGNPTEWLCSIIPIRDFRGFAKGYVLSGIDITEQLERKRLANWAQLAHDMQTNLSTIKLNAEHISNSDIDQIHSRQKKIIHQVNILMNRIRDIVTVGRTDILDLQIVNSYEICSQAVAEFDEELFPNVKFTLNVKNFELKCDKNKLVRAIRNAIENAIRALPDKKGEITITSDFDNNFAYFSIIDNGKGMDDETKSKFLKPYFTTSSQYGGSGIGTIIMQKVAEMHKGRIIVESKVNEGTNITFVIPFKISI